MMSRYYLSVKPNCIRCHVLKLEDGILTDLCLVRDRVHSIYTSSVLNEYALSARHDKLYRVSNHLFDICIFSYRNHMRLPFEVIDIRDFAKNYLSKRYENVLFKRLRTQKAVKDSLPQVV